MAEQNSKLSKPVAHNTPNLCDQLGIRVASLNVETMRGRKGEVSETLSQTKVDVCCLQESRWRGRSRLDC